MEAHRQMVIVSESHELSLVLPQDFPSGPAEVIILARSPRTGAAVKLSGVLSLPVDQLEGDPIAESLNELRETRKRRLETGDE